MGKEFTASEAKTRINDQKPTERIQKRFDVHILKVYRETANILKKVYEKVWISEDWEDSHDLGTCFREVRNFLLSA